MPEQSLEWKAEESLILWLKDTAAHGITLGIVPRHNEEDNTDELELPAISIKAERVEEVGINTGVFRMNLLVILAVNLFDTVELAGDQFFEKIESLMQWDDLSRELTNRVADFHVFGIIERSTRKEVERDAVNERPYLMTFYAQAQG